MKGFISSVLCCTCLACSALAAVRGTDATLRVATGENRESQTTLSRATGNSRNVSARNTGAAVPARAGTTRVRAGNVSVRSGMVNPRGAVTSSAANAVRSARVAKNKSPRAATVATNAFNQNYNECQDAYFACMDQFCALQNEKYRRCVCSSRLETVKSRERALANAGIQLQDFKDLNIEAILKTPAEVKAMLSASEGELKLANQRDNSASAQKLVAISDVLASTRTNAMSTAGQVDIAGDIKQIWNTTDLISGVNIANLTGESLYNAVHSQCSELVATQCPTQSALNMAVAAYGMYIENDCAVLLGAIDKQAVNANTAIRDTNREMMTARLENYDAHNSVAINECVAGVRADLTADTACGKDFVHCLDITGLYLSRTNGAPIYSATFYELENQVSLSGDVLNNPTNAKLVAELNRKKDFATNTLETCRDISDEVWDEFLRQAVTEIYQGQQAKIRQVKNECMEVVNTCYDEKTRQLRDYSNIEEQKLLSDRLELAEEMCQDKLIMCSNLYGGGAGGLDLLITEMQNITNQKIAKNCLASLQDYAKKLCRIPSSDTLHDYPYGCRVYSPGDAIYASNPECTYLSSLSINDFTLPDDSNSGYWTTELESLIGPGTDWENYSCPANRIYQSCNDGYYLHNGKCYDCSGTDWECRNGNAYSASSKCSGDYAGSLYQKMVAYAQQYCVRQSQINSGIPNEVLADVNIIMDALRVDMANVLAAECERQNGVWTTVFEKDVSGEPVDAKNMDFYNETNASIGWGLCKSVE